jgi:exodeoxyribonuclease III
MRIISYNVNGIRAAFKKGLIDWLKTNPADIICLQETKATKDDVDYKQLDKLGFHHHWFNAQKKGYSGVAVFSKIKPDNVVYGTGHQTSDDEGRVIQLDFGDIRLINAYFPSGTTGDERQKFKYAWLDEFHAYLTKLKKKYPKIILVGDYNIAHKEIDIHEWMTKFLDSGWIDTFREYHPEPHRYSWWSQRFPTVRLNNKGWRIDYIAVTTPLNGQLKNADIYHDVKHSDHCPIFVEIGKAK